VYFKPSEPELIVLDDKLEKTPQKTACHRRRDDSSSKLKKKLKRKELQRKIIRAQIELELKAQFKETNSTMELTRSKFNASINRIRLNIEMEQRIETMSWVVKKFEQESAHVQLPFKQRTSRTTSTCQPTWNSKSTPMT
jgi:hypothetical protein